MSQKRYFTILMNGASCYLDVCSALVSLSEGRSFLPFLGTVESPRPADNEIR